MNASLDGPHEIWARRWGWLVITLAVLLTYWPLSTFQYTLTHGDTLNCWLPWRWFISSCLMDGQFPLWNPHQQFGYPMHADLQGPAWYVESLAIGGTIGHSIYTLQALYLLYLIIGGLGMMRVIRTVHNDARIGLVIGIAYALGGFFTGHQMHFYTVISAAWLPWLFDAAIRLFREPGWRTAARTALFQGLLLTGGNHTFSIIACYVLSALFIALAWARWKESGWASIRPMLLWCFAAVVGASLIGVGVLHAWWEAAPYIARAGGLSYEAAAVDPLTVRSLISLLFPFATGTDMERLGTDAPMANTYMSALMLPLALAALLRKRTVIENVLLVFGIICAIAAFGAGTPVHRWLWSFAPGLDLFRFPAYFRWFTWLAMLVLAAGTLRAHWAGEFRRGWVEALLACTALSAIVITILSLVNMHPDGEGFSFFERIRAIDLDRRVLLGAVVTLPVLVVATVLARRRNLSFMWLLALVLLEMGWNTSLAQWNTAVSDIKPRWLCDRLNSLSAGPVIPEMVPTSTYDDNGQRLQHLAHNTQDFLGGFSRNGVNTFWLKNAMGLEVEHSALWNAMARQPVLYLADNIITWNDYHAEAIDPVRDSGLVVLASGSPMVFSKPRGAEDQMEITGFDGNSFMARCKSDHSALLVLQQSQYPGWEANVDGKHVPVLNVNIAAMAVEVPAGEHVVEFRYSKPIVHWLLAVSLITFFGLLFSLVLTAPGTAAKGAAFALFASVCWSLFGHTHRLPSAEDGMNEAARTLPDNASIVVNDDGSSPMPAQGDMVGWRLQANEPVDVGEAYMILRAAEQHRTSKAPGISREVHWIDAALKADPAVRAMILDRYEVVMMKEVGSTTDLHLVPSVRSPRWTMLSTALGAPRWLHAASPFGSGFTIPMERLSHDLGGSLVIDLVATAPREAKASIVFERKSGDRTTDYHALPIVVPAGWPEAVPCYAVLPIDEVYRPGEELHIYLWSHRGDSLSEQGFRVRVAPRTFYRW